MKSSKQIRSISIQRLIDESPDTSYLGEYSNKAESDYTIDRKHSEDCPSFFYGSDECSESCSADNVPRGEYRFFNPSFNYVNNAGQPAEGLTPDDVRKYTRQDYERMESLNSGQWSYLGIRAEAEIVINGLCQTITSGGVWGIESDSDSDYLRQIEQEELAQLEEQLAALGFKKKPIKAAIENCESKTA